MGRFSVAFVVVLAAASCASSVVVDGGVESLDAGADAGSREGGDQGLLPECATTIGDPCRLDVECQDGCGCNGLEICNGGQCTRARRLLCDDGLDCTMDSCTELGDDEGVCANVPDDDVCDDGNFCTGEETCDARFGCVPGEPFVCQPASLPDVPPQCAVTVCEPDIEGCTTSFQDEDGDGFGPHPLCGNDCDDMNPFRNPEAREDCAGEADRDLDCDGLPGSSDPDCAG